MTVCQECGLNVEIFGDHAPGCAMHEGKFYLDEPSDSSTEQASVQWSTLISVASERGSKLAQSILRDATLGGFDLDDPKDITMLDDVLFDENTKNIMNMCTWSGSMAMVQILLEQDLIDQESVAKYLGIPDSDGTI